MTIDEMIAVLQAAKEGKTILDAEGKVANIQQRCALQDYRVKPEPIEAYLWFDNYGHQFTTIKVSEKDFESYKRGGYTPKKFREVIE